MAAARRSAGREQARWTLRSDTTIPKLTINSRVDSSLPSFSMAGEANGAEARKNRCYSPDEWRH